MKALKVKKYKEIYKSITISFEFDLKFLGKK